MQNDLNTRPSIADRPSGISGGTIAVIVAAFLLLGALFMWGPWHDGTATNSSGGTTMGSASTTTRPAAPVTAPSTAPASR